ncbi:ABC transporter substrate-binding protein [Streptomyces meridianus]|uniref:ABC transporter substrate-binding protein n=1 Tax=Streptomyces meridianus TaxID=2938945 RepID=A0ABT0X919_9ACTN|nr:ABC transporter substrate-binding protein [Streptomyces meridianus]MCM2579022.1 ABC transporter substrate-binding protein [Streptomyces meridianus]
MRHWLPKAGMAVLAASLLAGCGSGSGSEDAGSKPPSFKGRGPITLATGKDTTGVMDKVLDQWNSTHPKEKVRMIELSESADEQRQRMIQNAELKSGDFSVLNMDVVWNAEFAANRWIVPLPKGEIDTGSMLKPTVEAATYRGNLYSAPWTSDGGLLYFRKDLLEKAGAEPPKTWAEMKKTCDKVLKLPEAKGMSCYAGQFDKYEGLSVNFSEMIHGAGGSVVDKAGKPTVNTPEAKKGLKWFADAFKDGTIPKEAITYKEEEGRQAFQKGDLVFHRQWPYQWALANAKDGSSKVAGKFNVAPLPGLDGPGTSSLGGHNLAISSDAKNKATALDFIKFMTNKENQKKRLLLTSQAPTNAALYEDKELLKKFPYLPTLKASINGAEPRPRVVQYGDATAAMQEAAYGALSGKTSPDAALAQLQKKLAGVNSK